MPLVDSVDYLAKRIYLSADSVGVDLDTLDVYKEIRALRRTIEDHRRYPMMIVAGGNIEKLPGVSYTPAYVQLKYGCRLIPFDADQLLRLIRDTFTDDGFVGRDVFDRTSLASSVDIDVDYAEIEIRVVDALGNTPLTLTQIENSTVLAKEATAQQAVASAKLAAALSA